MKKQNIAHAVADASCNFF